MHPRPPENTPLTIDASGVYFRLALTHSVLAGLNVVTHTHTCCAAEVQKVRDTGSCATSANALFRGAGLL